MARDMGDEYLRLLDLSSEYMAAAEAMIAALQGKLDTSDRQKAERGIKDRITRYITARKALIAYAKETAAALEAKL